MGHDDDRDAKRPQRNHERAPLAVRVATLEYPLITYLPAYPLHTVPCSTAEYPCAPLAVRVALHSSGGLAIAAVADASHLVRVREALAAACASKQAQSNAHQRNRNSSGPGSSQHGVLSGR